MGTARNRFFVYLLLANVLTLERQIFASVLAL